jgi:hypothetical protein
MERLHGHEIRFVARDASRLDVITVGTIEAVSQPGPSSNRLAEHAHERAQFVKVERLGQIMIEPRFPAELQVARIAPRRERNGFNARLNLLRLGDEIESITVSQAKIAQQHVYPHVVQQLQSVGHAFRCDHLVAGPRQKRGKDTAGIGMIFDQENVHGG